MKTIVYVDGFNLYYVAVKGTPFKWLNILQLCQQLLPNNQIVQLKYFTAQVSARPNDPGQPNRQRLYLRALQTLPGVEVIYGRFLTHVVSMPIANPTPGGPRYVNVIKTEEKGSDVNIATHMIHDGHKGLYDVAVLLSNDSDLAEPIRILRSEMGYVVGILNPFVKTLSFELKKVATFVKPIRTGVLAASQFPSQMQDATGAFHKPLIW